MKVKVHGNRVIMCAVMAVRIVRAAAKSDGASDRAYTLLNNARKKMDVPFQELDFENGGARDLAIRETADLVKTLTKFGRRM